MQSSIKLGNISIKKTDPDYFPFLVANQILGGATNSRLFFNIREQKGYTYGAYSGIDARRQPGAFWLKLRCVQMLLLHHCKNFYTS